MATTVTTVVAPISVGPGMKIGVYALDPSDDGYSGDALDFTDDFDYIYAAIPGGVDTEADNGLVFGIKLPSADTAITDSNVILNCYWSADGTDGESLIERATELAEVGLISVTVIGK